MTNILIVSLCLVKDDLLYTLDSIPFDSSYIEKYVVVSPLSNSKEFVSDICCRYPAINFLFLADDNSGVYNAMNFSLDSTSFDVPFIFLNAGDHFLATASAILNSLPTQINLYVHPGNPFWRLFRFLRYFVSLSPSSYAYFLLRSGLMPCSHQNILFPSHVMHFRYDPRFFLSADYALLLDLLSAKQFDISVSFGSIAETSPGGISDVRRTQVLSQRDFILSQKFGFPGSFSLICLYRAMIYLLKSWSRLFSLLNKIPSLFLDRFSGS